MMQKCALDNSRDTHLLPSDVRSPRHNSLPPGLGTPPRFQHLIKRLLLHACGHVGVPSTQSEEKQPLENSQKARQAGDKSGQYWVQLCFSPWFKFATDCTRSLISTLRLETVVDFTEPTCFLSEFNCCSFHVLLAETIMTGSPLSCTGAHRRAPKRHACTPSHPHTCLKNISTSLGRRACGDQPRQSPIVHIAHTQSTPIPLNIRTMQDIMLIGS